MNNKLYSTKTILELIEAQLEKEAILNFGNAIMKQSIPFGMTPLKKGERVEYLGPATCVDGKIRTIRGDIAFIPYHYLEMDRRENPFNELELAEITQYI